MIPKLDRILVADDETTFLESTVELLREEGFACDGAANAHVAKEMLAKKEYDLLIADIKMPGNLELELIKELDDQPPRLPVILVTGYPSLDTAMLATRLSVAGYLSKPIDFDDLVDLARKAIERYQYLREFDGRRKPAVESRQNLENRQAGQSVPFTSPPVMETLVAHSAAMAQVLEIIKKAAPTDSNILIVGETGAGKELLARTIHHLSTRAAGEFVPVDCVALPATLLESELFGYEKGAFTGAMGTKHGLFEFAHQGTLFLDEIAELDINLQAKLLRVLQERKFRRIGGKKLIEVDVRVIAAMNKNPKKALAAHRLRRDLYYRINVIPIYVPPLRDRIEDIPPLVQLFVEMGNAKSSFAPKSISSAALEMLKTYRWPGNIRQLKNIIERALTLSSKTAIATDDLPAYIRAAEKKGGKSFASLPLNKAKAGAIGNFEKKYLWELLKETHHDIAKAAEMAGVSERTIYRMVQRYGKPPK